MLNVDGGGERDRDDVDKGLIGGGESQAASQLTCRDMLLDLPEEL